MTRVTTKVYSHSSAMVPVICFPWNSSHPTVLLFTRNALGGSGSWRWLLVLISLYSQKAFTLLSMPRCPGEGCALLATRGYKDYPPWDIRASPKSPFSASSSCNLLFACLRNRDHSSVLATFTKERLLLEGLVSSPSFILLPILTLTPPVPKQGVLGGTPFPSERSFFRAKYFLG